MPLHTFAPPDTNLYARLERNERGRDLVVGDVHGDFATLRRALYELKVDERDRVVSLGDLVILASSSAAQRLGSARTEPERSLWPRNDAPPLVVGLDDIGCG